MSRGVRGLERLAVNAKVVRVLGSIPAPSDTVESEGRQMKAAFDNGHKIKKLPLKKEEKRR